MSKNDVENDDLDTILEKERRDSSKNEIAKSLFGAVGNVLHDYSCAVESKILLHGRMYITKNWICFYSAIFGVEKKIRIPFSHVLQITKEKTALVIPNAIAILTTKREYIFRSFWERDLCFDVLTKLHKKWRGIRKLSSFSELSKDKSFMISGKRSTFSDIPSPDKIAKDYNIINSKRAKSDSNIFAIHESLNEDDDDDNNNDDDDDEQNKDINDIFDDKNNNNKKDDNNGELDDEIKVDDNFKADDFEEEYNNINLKNSVTHENYLNASIPLIYKLFIKNDAIMGLDKFGKRRGDFDLDMENWNNINNGYKTRTMRYISPLKAMIGPSEVRVIKNQEYKKFGNIGLIVKSRVNLEGIPASSTFYVEDILVFKSINENQCEVKSYWEITFLKWTPIKGKIQSQTDSDTKTFWNDYFIEMERVIRIERGEGIDNNDDLDESKTINIQQNVENQTIQPIIQQQTQQNLQAPKVSKMRLILLFLLSGLLIFTMISMIIILFIILIISGYIDSPFIFDDALPSFNIGYFRLPKIDITNLISISNSEGNINFQCLNIEQLHEEINDLKELLLK